MKDYFNGIWTGRHLQLCSFLLVKKNRYIIAQLVFKLYHPRSSQFIETQPYIQEPLSLYDYQLKQVATKRLLQHKWPVQHSCINFYKWPVQHSCINFYGKLPRTKTAPLLQHTHIILLMYRYRQNTWHVVALGGLVVSVLTTGPKVAGSNPAEDDGF
jgi:hypothetical protein